MTRIVPRIAWSNGQVLRPPHFIGLEESLTSEVLAHVRASGLPTEGLLELDWNGEAPANGVLSLNRLVWIAPDGQLIALPGNAVLEGPLTFDSKDGNVVDAYLHRLGGERRAPGDRNIERTVTRIALSTRQVMEGSSQSILHLGTFEHGLKGWKLRNASIPPLLSLRNTPYLLSYLEDLQGELARTESALLVSDASPTLRGDSRVIRLRARFAVRRAQALLGDLLDGGMDLHPYLIFSGLRDLCLEFEAMGNLPIQELSELTYDHWRPGVCFTTLLVWLERQLTNPSLTSEVLRFSREATAHGVAYVLRDIPEVAFGPDVRVYLLLQRGQPEQEPSLTGARITALGRLDRTLVNNLTPLKLTLEEDSPLTRRFSAWCKVHRVSHEGAHATEAWAEASKERALALVQRSLEPDAALFLYWEQAGQERA